MTLAARRNSAERRACRNRFASRTWWRKFAAPILQDRKSSRPRRHPRDFPRKRDSSPREGAAQNDPNHVLRMWRGEPAATRRTSRFGFFLGGVDAEIPHPQIHAVGKNFRERVFPRRKLLAERVAENILRHLPLLYGNGVDVLADLLAEETLDGFKASVVAFHLRANQNDFRSVFAGAAAVAHGSRAIGIGRRFAQIKFRSG